MPDNAISTYVKALRLMKYIVRTMYGVLGKSYHGTVFAPLLKPDKAAEH